MSDDERIGAGVFCLCAATISLISAAYDNWFTATLFCIMSCTAAVVAVKG